jgi:predicted protein tyrosine phosphatase
LFKNDDRFRIRSVGLSPKSERKISEKDLLWEDWVLVMESEHRSKVKSLYGQMDWPEIEVLHIPDENEFMDEELIDILTNKMNYSVKERFGV